MDKKKENMYMKKSKKVNSFKNKKEYIHSLSLSIYIYIFVCVCVVNKRTHIRNMF
jgi:hypothetical protein